MHRVTYRTNNNDALFKEFETFKEAVDYCNKLPVDSVLEIKYYEDSVDNRPAFWSEE